MSYQPESRGRRESKAGIQRRQSSSREQNPLTHPTPAPASYSLRCPAKPGRQKIHTIRPNGLVIRHPALRQCLRLNVVYSSDPPLGNEHSRPEHRTGDADNRADDRSGQHDIPAARADAHVVLEQLADLTYGETGAVEDDQEDADAGDAAAAGKGQGQGGGAEDHEDERPGELGSAGDGVGRADSRLLEMSRPGEDGPEDVVADERARGDAEVVDGHAESVWAGDGDRRPPDDLNL